MHQSPANRGERHPREHQHHPALLNPYIGPRSFETGERQQERANKRIRQALVGAVVAAVVAVGLAAVAFQLNQRATEARIRAETQEKRAEQEARIARVRQLVARTQAEMEEKPQLSLLLALTATQSLQPGDPPLSVEQTALTTLLDAEGRRALARTARKHT